MTRIAEPRVTLITRANCHLCDVAKEALARVAATTGVTWQEVDVDADPTLLDEYSDLVPVILVDGKDARVLAGRGGPAAARPRHMTLR